MSDFGNIESNQLLGSPGKPYTLAADPSAAPGYAAAIGAIGSFGGVYYIKFGTADTEWKPLTGASSYPTDEDYYKFRASYLMKSPRMTCWYWNDCLEPVSESFILQGGVGSYTTKQNDCGILTLTQAAGGGANLFLGNESTGTTAGNFIPGGTNGVWYMAYRAKFIGSDVKCYTELWATDKSVANKYIVFGDSTNTTATWSLAYDGSAPVYSAVDNDEQTHVHELVRVGGVTTYYLDGNSIISGANYFSSNNGCLMIRIGNTAGSLTTRIAHFDWVCAAVGGNNARTIT
jgi:hypothetical protein